LVLRLGTVREVVSVEKILEADGDGPKIGEIEPGRCVRDEIRVYSTFACTAFEVRIALTELPGRQPKPRASRPLLPDLRQCSAFSEWAPAWLHLFAARSDKTAAIGAKHRPINPIIISVGYAASA
jgi:hypothetical protein